MELKKYMKIKRRMTKTNEDNICCLDCQEFEPMYPEKTVLEDFLEKLLLLLATTVAGLRWRNEKNQ